MSVVCLEHRIPASTNLMTISHSYLEISRVKLCTYVVITIKYFLDQIFSSELYLLFTRPTRITGTVATIIYKIFCSELRRTQSVRCMPIFVMCDNKFYVVNHEDPTVKCKKNVVEDSLNRLEHDVNDINLETVTNESNPNFAFSRIMK